MRLHLILVAILTILIPLTAWSQEPGAITAEESPVMTWTLPGTGAGALVVNPVDGSLWTFLHQTHNLVALDGETGSVILDVPIDLSPTEMAFAPDGSTGFIVGEPMSDQIIAAGIIEAFDPATGGKIAQMELEGAGNAVCATSDGSIYVAAGMQYAYQGTVYKLSWDKSRKTFAIVGQADTGKLPWALAVFKGNLYVTDQELQWTAQPDGSEGPPYGAWVWVYEASTLSLVDKIWVGINPTRFAVTKSGLLVACSGSKQTEGLYEPALVLLRTPDAADSEYIFVDNYGASDIAGPKEANWAIASLASWMPAPSGSQASLWHQALSSMVPEARRWVDTGSVAIIDLDELERLDTAQAGDAESSEKTDQGSTGDAGQSDDSGTGGTVEEGQPQVAGFMPQAVNVIDGAVLREIAVSLDGSLMYAIAKNVTDGTESLIVVPVDLIRNAGEGPIYTVSNP